MFVLCAVVLAVCLQVISAEPPPHCRGPPPGVERPFDCCKLPKFFEEKDLEECGFKKPEEREKRPNGPPPPPPDCSKQICLFNKYDLLTDDEVDHEKVTNFLDKHAAENEEFKPAIEIAKENCVGKELPGPPHLCEAQKMMFCLTTVLFLGCPNWDQSDGCTALKKHMEECKPHFMKQ